jgi:hypothetical protein
MIHALPGSFDSAQNDSPVAQAKSEQSFALPVRVRDPDSNSLNQLSHCALLVADRGDGGLQYCERFIYLFVRDHQRN